MDKKNNKGAETKVADSIKEAIGKITGDTEMQAQNTADKAQISTQTPPAARKTKP